MSAPKSHPRPGTPSPSGPKQAHPPAKDPGGKIEPGRGTGSAVSSAAAASLVMSSPPIGMSSWLRELARQEHDRTAEIKRFNEAAIPLLKALHEQISLDVASFKTEFPDASVDVSMDPARGLLEVINHGRGNPPPQVRITSNAADQTLVLAFDFRPSLNKELPMTIAEGKLVVDAAGGIATGTLSQIALTPVLFPELTSNTLLYHSLTEIPGLGG